MAKDKKSDKLEKEYIIASNPYEPSLLKEEKISMPKKEFVKEHKKLVRVLRGSNRKEQLEEAKEQEQELKEETSKSDSASESVGCGEGLSGKICRHNRKKLNKFVSAYKVKKSLDFQNTKTSVETADQQLAEETASPELIDYIKTALKNDIQKIPLAKGTLTLAMMEPGLYNGFFQDLDGQVVEKFDNVTPEIVAKNLELKNLYDRPLPLPVEPPPAVTPAPIKEPEESTKPIKSLKIKFGDFELELKKSVRDFVNDFKKARHVDPDLIRKAVSTWRRRNELMDFKSDRVAARELLNNWEVYSEDFNQIVYALEQQRKG